MRLVIELKRDAVPQVVLNHLFAQTALQVSFGVIMLAIVDGRPRILSLRDCLLHYLDHRRQVVTRAASSSFARRSLAARSSKAWVWRSIRSTASSPSSAPPGPGQKRRTTSWPSR